MSDVPPPNFNDADKSTMYNIAVLFGKGIVYAIAFWAVYRGFWFVFPAGGTTTTYDVSAQQASQIMEESEKQQLRMRAILTKQEEQAKRFDAILDRWEKQAGPPKK